MARIRSIKPGFCTSVAIAELSIVAELHFAKLWTYADDHGRGVDDGRAIKGAIWSQRDEVDHVRVEQLQAELAQRGRIIRYRVRGRRYFEVVNWEEHQRPQHPKPSDLPGLDQADEIQDASPAPASAPEGPHEASPEKGLVVVEERSSRGEVEERERNTLALVPTSVSSQATTGVDVFNAWVQATGKDPRRTKFSPERQRLVAKALKDYPPEDVIDAVRGWRHCPHNRGETNGTVYNDLELLLRNASKLERFRDLERQGAPPTLPRPGYQTTIANINAMRGRAQ